MTALSGPTPPGGMERLSAAGANISTGGPSAIGGWQ